MDNLSKANKALDLLKDLKNTNFNDQQEIAGKLDQLKKNELFNEIMNSAKTETPKSVQKTNEDPLNPRQKNFFNNIVNAINNPESVNNPANLNTIIQNLPSNTNDIINLLANGNISELVENSNNLLNDLTSNVNNSLHDLTDNIPPEADNILGELGNTDLVQVIQDLSSNPDFKLPENLDDLSGFMNNITDILAQYNVSISQDMLANLTKYHWHLFTLFFFKSTHLFWY